MASGLKILGIQVELNGQKVTLTMDEARSLHEELKKIFQEPVFVTNPFDRLIGQPYQPVVPMWGATSSGEGE